MYIYADIRCLQDGNYAFRGVGHHSATLLQGRRTYLPESYLIGFFDPALPVLPACYHELFDEIRPWSQATMVEQESIFIALSPMTHDLAVCGRLLDRQRILACALIYDFIPLDVPQRYLSNSAALHGYAANMLWLEAFHLYSPISHYSERRLFELLDVRRSESFVSGVALRPAFEAIMQANATPDNTSRVRSRPTKRDYFFFVGGGDPRKNIDVLLPAHASLVSSGYDTDLVIVGNYPAEYQASITKQYINHDGKANKLIFRHGITDQELADWYYEAAATICSSHIEGFSLPVIEAIACGSPMLASDCEAHCELVTDATTRFPSTDDVALRGLMFRILTEPTYRKSLIEQQANIPGRFLADQVHENFWKPLCDQYYSRFHASGEASSTAKTQFSAYHAASDRPSLAIISPFPPERSGVADYTRRTVEALADKACVDVFTEATAPTKTRGVNAFHPTSDWAYLSGKYDRVLTVIGNSHFHIKPIELQRAYGGPCLVHDNRLAELYNWWKGPHYFNQMASKSFGREVPFEESQSWMANPGALPGIFFDELIDSANPLIVHSRGIQKQVAKQYGVQAEYLPFCCYRGFDESELIPTARQSARAKLGIADGVVLIVSLGIVSPSKAPEQCIDAIEHLRHAGVPAVLHFVGSCDTYRNVLIAQAKRLGIEHAIHFCDDWISDQDYRCYVQAADFAIQLRTHFFGGLSGAMLDCIASGLPTVANDDLAEALDSPHSVMRISDRMLAREVSAAVLRAYNQGMHFNRLVACRTDYLQAHSFDRYADELLRVLRLATPSQQPIVPRIFSPYTTTPSQLA